MLDREWQPETARHLQEWLRKTEATAKSWSLLVEPRDGDHDSDNARVAADTLMDIAAKLHEAGHLAWLMRND